MMIIMKKIFSLSAILTSIVFLMSFSALLLPMMTVIKVEKQLAMEKLMIKINSQPHTKHCLVELW